MCTVQIKGIPFSSGFNKADSKSNALTCVQLFYYIPVGMWIKLFKVCLLRIHKMNITSNIDL